MPEPRQRTRRTAAGGRPTKINPAARDAIAKGLARGATMNEISAAAGVSVDSLERWLARARRADAARAAGKTVAARERPFLDLYDELAEAEQDVEFEALKAVTDYLTVGVDLETAAAAARVPIKMLERILNRATQIQNRRDDGDAIDAEGLEFLKLLDGLDHAIALTKVQSLASLNRAARDDWHAAALLLERLFPDEFASPNRRPKGQSAGGRPIGATSAPDRPATSDEPPPRIRLTRVK